MCALGRLAAIPSFSLVHPNGRLDLFALGPMPGECINSLGGAVWFWGIIGDYFNLYMACYFWGEPLWWVSFCCRGDVPGGKRGGRGFYAYLVHAIID